MSGGMDSGGYFDVFAEETIPESLGSMVSFLLRQLRIAKGKIADAEQRCKESSLEIARLQKTHQTLRADIQKLDQELRAERAKKSKQRGNRKGSA